MSTPISEDKSFRTFTTFIMQQGKLLYRDMPWRRTQDPYRIFISEMMLQQTQVDRVVPKYTLFISLFPTIQEIAAVTLADILQTWTGLGYNRRARYIHEGAKKVVNEYKGRLPKEVSELLSLPGVGPNTAGAIRAYAYNEPSIFIETNIRTVYIHHFFAYEKMVSDDAIKSILRKTIDYNNPRTFYWALMDYGAWLKDNNYSYNKKSKHYKKQSTFQGSIREVRGRIVTILTAGERDIAVLRAMLPLDERFDVALQKLIAEKIVVQTGPMLSLPTKKI